MPKERKPRLGPDGLTAPERNFVHHLLQGKTKTDAYLMSFNRGRKTDKSVWEEACRVSKRPKVLSRLHELLAETEQQNMDTRQQALADLQADMELAREKGNMSALAAMHDRRMRALGMLSDRLVLSPEGQLTDDQLIDALAGENTDMKQQLTLLLHGKSGFDS